MAISSSLFHDYLPVLLVTQSFLSFSFVLLLSFFSLWILYRVSPLHPLYHIPGPLLSRTTSLWLTYHAWIGDEPTLVHSLHQRYGPILRTGPGSVDISDSDALSSIYTDKGGFLKADFYQNFAIDGHNTIFSEVVPEKRSARAKAVMPLFGMNKVREWEAWQAVVAEWVDKLKARKAAAGKGVKVDVLEVNRGIALDVVSGYLFGRKFGSIDQVAAEPDNTDDLEQGKKHGSIRAAGMVDSMVAVSRFWYLPAPLFKLVDWLEQTFSPNAEAVQSFDTVDQFISSITTDAQASPEKHTHTYQGRLLAAAISLSEVKAQCKDLVFAGMDSTGMNLSTLLFNLTKHPDILARLRDEVLASPPTEDPHSLPYLRACVSETLRISMANPSRLPRVVPSGGWTFKSTPLPQGTIVSCQPYSIHFNESVFPDPREFRPERWLDASDQMRRDNIAFGLGPRQCIARNLAMMTLCMCARGIVASELLEGGRPVGKEIRQLEWFNAKVIGKRVDLVWD